MRVGIGTRYAVSLSLLTLAVVAVALAVAGAVVFNRASTLQRQIHDSIVSAETSETEEELKAAGRYLSRRLFNPLSRLDVQRLHQEISQAREWLPVTEFLVTDVDRRVLTDGTASLARYGELVVGPLPTEAPWEPLLEHHEDSTELRFAIHAGDVVVGWSVVTVADAPYLASLRGLEARTASLWTEYRTSFLFLGGLILATTLALGLITSARLSRTLARPLTEMSRAAREFAAGRFDHVVSLDSPGELGQLARSLNSMARDLQTHEVERQRLIADLERKNTELEQFNYTVSHDLKSPLVTILGFTGVAASELRSGHPDRIPQLLSRITSAGQRMSRLLDDLLELSRSGRIVKPPTDVSLQDVAREAVELVTGQLDSRGVRVDISPELPVIRGDRQRLLEVLQNLVENAVKFMEDEPQPRIEIGVGDVGEGRVFYVKDNGRGIEQGRQARVFDLFETLDSGTEGTGVGLTLVRRVVEAHGGRVWVESDGPGRGTAVYFTLPGDGSGGKDTGANPAA